MMEERPEFVPFMVRQTNIGRPFHPEIFGLQAQQRIGRIEHARISLQQVFAQTRDPIVQHITQGTIPDRPGLSGAAAYFEAIGFADKTHVPVVLRGRQQIHQSHQLVTGQMLGGRRARLDGAAVKCGIGSVRCRRAVLNVASRTPNAKRQTASVWRLKD